HREIMFHEDAVVELPAADDNNLKQIEDIRYFADNGFDIIVVAPNEAAALTPVIKEVYESGIPVITFDRDIIGDTYTARIGVDNEGLGRSAAHYALHLLGEGANAIEIYGLRGSTPAEERHKGFVKEFTKGHGTLLASVAADWNKEDAVPVVDSLLNIYGDVDLIYAHNDRMAIGAAEVARRTGRNDIKIIGIDAAPEIGIQAVADSLIDATFFYPTEGHRLIQTALAILKGEPYQRETRLPLSSAVDLSNADILLMQNETLKNETDKIKVLKAQIDDYWAQHSSQTSLFYASIAIIILLFGVAFLLLRAYWQHSRHQKTLMAKNRLLEEERDKQKSLNTQLEEATQSKLMFFTNVSHDLRTPLTLIAEPVSQLATAENLTAGQHTLIKIADKNVKILRRLINQILDFRKYENGKLDLHLTEIDFSKAIRDWMESFYTIARKRDIKLSLIVPEKDTSTVAIDAEKLERVVFNLVSNAFKYTPDNGTITVSYDNDGSCMTLKVADTGKGISQRDLGNIFDRFYQVDRVHPNGSGIGLSLVKAFVELHGGSISVESALDKGSTFTVVLPVRHIADTSADVEKNISGQEVEAELDNIDGNLTFDDDKPVVLVIDDNKDIQRLVGQLLDESYNIITASNGPEGITKSAKYIPDLIICDVMMPVMDGLECCKRIKNEMSTSHIPVLMLTACSMDEQRIQGYDSGADGYLSKPFSGAVLKSRCSSLIANRKRIKELWQNPLPAQADKHAATDKPKPSGDIDNEFYARFIEIFNAEMGNADLNVDSMASKMGLERSQFYRKIKALTNYSPVELIRRLRLRRSRTLITSSDKTISEIAYETGFSTPAYFTKCYRDAYGETPTETRSKLTK
ncbi:MAG: substrate-binding domain-containing protein, partial [Muribaculum sp.]